MISGRLRASLIIRGHQPQLAGIRRPQCRCLHLARAASSAPGLQNAPWTGAPQEQEVHKVVSAVDTAQALLLGSATLQALRQLQERVRGMTLPQEPSSEVQQWFLRDRGFDVAEAADKLAKMSRWRARARPEQLRSSDVAAELRTGKAFVHDKPDRYGRPVVVVLARKHLVGALSCKSASHAGSKALSSLSADQRNLEESQRLGVYVIEQALGQLDADHDSILGIFDMRGFSWANADFAFVEFLVRAPLYRPCKPQSDLPQCLLALRSAAAGASSKLFSLRSWQLPCSPLYWSS